MAGGSTEGAARADLRFGDCVRRIRELPDDSVDLLWFDPPFGITRAPWDAPLDWEALWPEMRRVLKPHGNILIHTSIPFTFHLTSLFRPRYWFIWDKGTTTGFLNANRQPLRAQEEILVYFFDSKCHKYNPIKSDVDTVRRIKRAPQKRNQFYDNFAPPTESEYAGRFPTNILRFPAERRTKSVAPCNKPAAMLDYLIDMFTDPGDTVLDITAGAGTTGERVCAKGRHFVGFDVSPDHFDACVERLSSLDNVSVASKPPSESERAAWKETLRIAEGEKTQSGRSFKKRRWAYDANGRPTFGAASGKPQERSSGVKKAKPRRAETPRKMVHSK